MPHIWWKEKPMQLFQQWHPFIDQILLLLRKDQNDTIRSAPSDLFIDIRRSTSARLRPLRQRTRQARRTSGYADRHA